METGWLSRFGALKLNRDQGMTLETRLKIHTSVTVSFWDSLPQKAYELLKICFSFFSVQLQKFVMHLFFHLRKELIRKSLCSPIFKNITEILNYLECTQRPALF